jgi:hypothetical protein
VVSFCEHGNENSGSIKGGEFIDLLTLLLGVAVVFKQPTVTYMLTEDAADLFVRGFTHRGFAYSRKMYCGNICASRRRSLALSRSLLRRRTE